MPINNEIYDTLERMMAMVMVINSGKMDFSKKDEDDSRRIMNEALDSVIEQTNQEYIDKLVIQEYKKKWMSKI